MVMAGRSAARNDSADLDAAPLARRERGEESASAHERFRAAMPIAQRLAYFDHAAVAPLPSPARESIKKWLDEATEQGDTVWSRWSARMEQVRAAAARLINADPVEIALVPNT